MSANEKSAEPRIASMARFSAFIVARGFRFPPRSTVTAKPSSRHCQDFISICHSLSGEAKARRIDGHPCSRAGMFYARHFEVIGVKRLVDNDRIVSIGPRAHHGRRDISRTRPHGDADAHGRNSQAAKPRVQRH